MTIPKNQSGNDQRCDCGKLLFKRTRRGFEFMCHRCKRIHLIPIDWFAEEYRSLCPIGEQHIKPIEARGPESHAPEKRR